VTEIILGCGSRKRDRPCPAWRMYQGPVFRTALHWSLSVAALPDIYILSGKYGLIPSETVISPYESRIGTPSQVCTRASVTQQAAALGLDQRRPLLVNIGKPYLAVLSLPRYDLLTDYMDLPDTRYGYQGSWFKQHHGRLPGRLADRLEDAA
jgi:hypothetical protein